MDCIFCKIAKGEIPSVKVFEDERIFAFLDINPVTKGHCLIIPKQHFENVFDLAENVLAEIVKVAKELSKNIKDNLGATGVNLINSSGKSAEQTVFHFHLHVVPRYDDGRVMKIIENFQSEKANINDLQKLAERIKILSE